MKGFIITLAAICCLPVTAQEAWSLRRCIDHAVTHNINIRQTANAAEQQAVSVNTAKFARLPNLQASAGQQWNWGRTQTAVKDAETGDYSTVYVNTHSNGSNLSVGTSVPIFTGLQLPNKLSMAKLDLQAAIADLAKAKEDIAIQVAQAYLQVLFCKEVYGVAYTQVELSKQQWQRLKRLQELGKSGTAEVAEAEARVASDELNVVQCRNDYDLALLELSQLIELETPEGFTLEEPQQEVSTTPLTPPDDIYQTALLQKPSVQAARYRLEGSRHNIRVAQSGYYPQLYLNGSLSTSYYSTLERSFSQQLNDNFNKYIGLSLSIPLFNRLATRNGVRTAKLQQKNYALQLEGVKKVLYKEIQQAWYNATAALAKYESSRSAAQAGREAFRLMTGKYENGMANAVEYNESKQNLLQAESAELQAKYDYLFRTKILDFYQGKEIQ